MFCFSYNSMGGHGALICFLKNPGLYKVRSREHTMSLDKIPLNVQYWLSKISASLIGRNGSI